MEPISRYAILVKNNEDFIRLKCESYTMIIQEFNKDIFLSNGMTYNALTAFTTRATTPGFTFKVKITSKTKIEFIGVMRAVSEDKFRAIPYLIL